MAEIYEINELIAKVEKRFIKRLEKERLVQLSYQEYGYQI